MTIIGVSLILISITAIMFFALNIKIEKLAGMKKDVQESLDRLQEINKKLFVHESRVQCLQNGYERISKRLDLLEENANKACVCNNDAVKVEMQDQLELADTNKNKKGIRIKEKKIEIPLKKK